ncbi:hypothetical protein [Bacillus haynesii]|uniref:hypothetical protein n=1 Tax=Bacillus haynesii TaxID=1925021 RepID=UPI002280BECD|nr:hypothetical protein [Bacillus haynesii]MCY7993828.1 hypothetical protein [Bacillus haynesii]MCY8555669.1 hypothetical protein [Bacillus haynesii]MCY8624361.1 hypothetical protein [Bacillus haynesii]
MAGLQLLKSCFVSIVAPDIGLPVIRDEKDLPQKADEPFLSHLSLLGARQPSTLAESS